MKTSKVHRILSKAKRREDIGIETTLLKDVETITDKKTKFKTDSKNRFSQIVKLRKENSWSELRAISIANAYSAIIAKLSFEISGKEVHPIVEKRIADKWLTTFVKLDSMLQELKIPSVLYLRTHLKISSGRIIIPALATHAAINRFVDYLERDLSEKYLLPQDMEREIFERCSLGHTDELRQLLTEYHLGRQYLEDVSRYSRILDRDLMMIVELRNLPGGYLVTIDDLQSLRESGAITDEIAEKIDKARSMLSKPGVRSAFYSEVKNYGGN